MVFSAKSVPWKGMIRLNTGRSTSKHLLSVCKFCLIGISTTLLATSVALSQTVATGSVGRGSALEAAAQDQQAGGGSPSDADAEIIQELERMRTRIQELESQLKQHHAGTSEHADLAKVAERSEQLVSDSGSSSAATVQT